jgi:hypothetical protein
MRKVRFDPGFRSMKRSLFVELERRNMFKAATAYLALGWARHPAASACSTAWERRRTI